MSTCEQLAETATTGVAPALHAVDCLANETASFAFGRLFGGSGALLMPALTILLTLYIGFFAISLLTGRSRLGVADLTPRMMTLGLVLTFVTSWVAYQSVVWNLAVGAPDQLAGILMGTPGSATELFGNQMDAAFAAIAHTGETAAANSQAATQQAGTFTPANLMWLAAVMLLLGTVGILVTARIALAVLLMVGPVFVIMALFNGSRGLFAGWLRGVVLTAVTPLFVVLGGSFMLHLLAPVVARLYDEGGINSSAVLALFLIAAVHLALMGMVMTVLGATVSGWSVFGLVQKNDRAGSHRTDFIRTGVAPVAPPAAAVATTRRLVAASPALATVVAAPEPAVANTGEIETRRTADFTRVTQAPSVHMSVRGPIRHRASGIGSNFRRASAPTLEIIR